jgi:hypothetical protein
MLTSSSCSWCHAINQIGGGTTFCKVCGHDAARARMDCACPACASRRTTPTVMIDSDEIRRLFRERA